jgi:hypothetical protein
MLALATSVMLGFVVLTVSTPAFAAEDGVPGTPAVAAPADPAPTADEGGMAATVRRALRSLERLRVVPARDIGERTRRPSRLNVASQ